MSQVLQNVFKQRAKTAWLVSQSWTRAARWKQYPRWQQSGAALACPGLLCLQKANNEGCVVGTKDGAVIQDSLYTDGGTQGDIYLHIVMTEAFDSRTVPLKWNSTQLLQWDVVLFKDAGECRYADSVDVSEGYLICDDLLSQFMMPDFVYLPKRCWLWPPSVHHWTQSALHPVQVVWQFCRK